MSRILILDDMERCHTNVSSNLDASYEVLSAFDEVEAYQMLVEQRPDLAIIDVNLDPENPDLTQGLDLIARVRAEGLPVKVICASIKNYRVAAKEAGADVFMFKRALYVDVQGTVDTVLDS